MISHLKGKVFHKDRGFLIIEAGGVGYKVFANAHALAKIPIGEEASFWTHMAVRENSHDLYGFETKEELEFFELLLGISGIGPKSALGILDITSVDNLRQAVQANDITYLTKVSGIGKKSAEKIVLELRDKLGALEDEAGYTLRGDSDALEALTALGYGVKESREVLKNLPPETTDVGERIREALKLLGKN